MKKAVFCILMSLILLGMLIAISIFIYLATPPSSEKITKIVFIRQGATFTEVARTLKENGIIKGIRKFSLLVRCCRDTRRIKAGEYCLNTAMLPLDVLETLVKGNVVEHLITIPEGYNLYQIADLLYKAELVNRDKFLNMCLDPSFVSSLGLEGYSLEGYLFPDTYRTAKNAGEKRILELMVARFRKVWVDEYAKMAEELGFTMREVVTLASIIEKETGSPWERPLISAVFHNRLKKRIRLQSDPTAVYGIPDFQGKVTKRHLKRESPYNTYRHSGLPPGPIANPGEASIIAVLYPAKVDHLYFVSKKDGTHHFSNNLREHNMAIRKYQRRNR